MAIHTLVKVANQTKAAPAARVAAASALLDRGWGKPMQPLSGPDDQPLFPETIRINLVKPGGSV